MTERVNRPSNRRLATALQLILFEITVTPTSPKRSDNLLDAWKRLERFCLHRPEPHEPDLFTRVEEQPTPSPTTPSPAPESEPSTPLPDTTEEG